MLQFSSLLRDGSDIYRFPALHSIALFPVVKFNCVVLSLSQIYLLCKPGPGSTTGLQEQCVQIQSAKHSS